MRRLLEIAIALLLAGCQPVPSSFPTPTASAGTPLQSAEPTPLTTPSRTALPTPSQYTTGSIRWTRVVPPGESCHVTAAVVRHDGSVLAICAADAGLTIHVLRSANGRDWTLSTARGMAPTTSMDIVLVTALAERPDKTLVAVGAEALDDVSRGDAASWTSADGLTWRRGPAGGDLADAEMLGVIATQSGFVAVGDDGFPGGNTQLPSLRGAAAWTSSDGSHWRRTPAPENGSKREMRGIVKTRSGWAAWGDGPGPGSGAVWTSADGRTWVLGQAPRGGNWGPIGRVEPTTGGLVAVGMWTTVENTGVEVTTFGIWGSADDGRSWSVVPNGIDVTVGPLWDIAALNGALIATGANGLVITSRDAGSTWSWAPPEPSGWIALLSPVVPFHGELIAFANETTDAGTTQDIWIGEIQR